MNYIETFKYADKDDLKAQVNAFLQSTKDTYTDLLVLDNNIAVLVMFQDVQTAQASVNP